MGEQAWSEKQLLIKRAKQTADEQTQAFMQSETSPKHVLIVIIDWSEMC